MLNFEYEEDRTLFEGLLCDENESLAGYADLFDFRPATEKRRECSRLVKTVLPKLKRQRGEVCMLQYAPDCDASSGLTIDHLIPLATNVLNKSLRGVTGRRLPDGRWIKAPSQSSARTTSETSSSPAATATPSRSTAFSGGRP